jgi:hypothetical protein
VTRALIVALLLAAPARAQDLPELRLEGFTSWDWAPYLRPDPDAVPAVAQLRVAPRVRAKWQAVRAAVELEYRHDFLDPGRRRLFLREASLGLRWRGLFVEAGALLPRWGVMDWESPMDVIVAWDYEELLQREPLPVPALRVGFARDAVSIEGVLVPAFVPSRARLDAPSRWDVRRYLPQVQEVPGPLGDPLVFRNVYEEFEDGVPSGDADDGSRGLEGGVRAQFFLPHVDLGVGWFAGHDRLPTRNRFHTIVRDRDLDGGADYLQDFVVPVHVAPVHHRIHVPGASVAATLGPVVLKGEGAVVLTEDLAHADPLIDDPYARLAAGAELVLADFARGMDLALRVQWSADLELPREGDDVKNQDRAWPIFTPEEEGDALVATDYQEGDQASPEFHHTFEHAWTWNVNWAFTEEIALDVRGYVSTFQDVFLMPRLAVTVGGHLELSAGALLILHTGADTVFHPFAENHRLEFGVKYRL